MRVGIWIPSTEFPVDRASLSDFARTAESAGFDHLVSSDHVLTTRLPDDHSSATMMSRGYHEPLITFAALASQVSLDFATSVLVLPQRPAALVAKQMAELVWLFGDRFRFGVGSGWNEPEFEALGVSFADRGAVMTDQVEVIEALWRQQFVDHTGPHHTLSGVGIEPRPARARPPLWFGGHGRRVLERTARHGDGWIPLADPTDSKLLRDLVTLQQLLEESDRDSATLGLEGRISLMAAGPLDEYRRSVEQWRDLGATHLTISYEGGGFADVESALKVATDLLRASL